MKQSTLKTLALKGQEDQEALFFSSTVSNYNPPVFALEMGYYSGGDGDRYELSRDQLLELADMINAHLQANDLPTEGKYSNQTYPPIGEGSFNIGEECFPGCKACTDIVEDLPDEDLIAKAFYDQDSTVPCNREDYKPLTGNVIRDLTNHADLLVKDYQKSREEGSVLPSYCGATSEDDVPMA